MIELLEMGPYESAGIFPLKNKSLDWLRQYQGLALPVIPPSTKAARSYYFSQLPNFVTISPKSGKSGVKLEEFAQQWNRTADGHDRFYITVEMLRAYGKRW